mmetsp:Transcript_15609/g.21578  ORF Transcript_15609/g.21578 Transcript_15609/m.21578 type:complete len:333 (-) Transcript_15609:138-1136(-)|eukprot:CAMPEP_0196587526 /NCGR_PEP_ID=MMETSP1081-20130531/57712_1 /TAXON_ID=36882 /ORGANISM="Pyramimonas amylifera, Strain CCMP720" /LENGTH=332 /DNA_ID=CAMNT_0041909723 /DNA_START=134 /DNA_END=1132 /DNA_ORIENTATION=+
MFSLAAQLTTSPIKTHDQSCGVINGGRSDGVRATGGLGRLVLSPTFSLKSGLSNRGGLALVKAKGGFGDQLLDFIEAGPKMRRWYGQGEQDEEDYDIDFDDEEEEDEGEDNRPTVLVTDADSEMGQILVLQLILQRQRVRALVSDIKKSKAGFGDYVEPFQGDCEDAESLVPALKGSKMVICCGKVGRLAEVASNTRGVQHIVLLSGTGTSTGASEAPVGGGLLGGLFSGEAAERKLLRSVEREAEVARGKVPYTIVRLGQFKEVAGGQNFSLQQGDTLKGTISREGAAMVCIQAALSPKPSKGLVFEVVGNAASGISASQLEDGIKSLKQE